MTGLAPWPPEGPADWWLLLLQAGMVASVCVAGLVLAYSLPLT